MALYASVYGDVMTEIPGDGGCRGGGEKGSGRQSGESGIHCTNAGTQIKECC